MKRISVVTPCFNEEANIREVHRQVREVFAAFPDYQREHLFIENASTDGTLRILRELAAEDDDVKVIVNTRNFGQLRSPYHGVLSATGDAVVVLVADLQDPPELIKEFVARWEEGFKIVIGVRSSSDEHGPRAAMRAVFYRLIDRLSDVPLTRNFTGFGLYDRVVVEALRRYEEPEPYFRGLISEVGYPRAEIAYRQRLRQRGRSANTLSSLVDVAVQGITTHSILPLRMATYLGAGLSAITVVALLAVLIVKLAAWHSFHAGMLLLMLGAYLLLSLLMLLIGILGEYVGAVHRRAQHRPLVVERERINFH